MGDLQKLLQQAKLVAENDLYSDVGAEIETAVAALNSNLTGVNALAQGVKLAPALLASGNQLLIDEGHAILSWVHDELVKGGQHIDPTPAPVPVAAAPPK